MREYKQMFLYESLGNAAAYDPAAGADLIRRRIQG